MITKLLRAASHERSVVALFFILRKVGDRLRGRLVAKVMGWPRSYLGKNSKILGTRGITIGEGAYINRNAWIEAVHDFAGQSFNPFIQIGRGFSASDRIHITSINHIEIGDNCLFGSGVFVSDHNHGAYRGDEQSTPSEFPIQRRLVSHGPVIIGSNVWLGDNVVVMGPVRIGNGVVVGANSVITRDLPDRVIAVGIPARIIKKYDEELGKWVIIDR